MNKFGLLHEENDPAPGNTQAFADKLASFPVAAPKHRIDIAAADAAAAPHGFVSREPAPLPPAYAPPQPAARRRRFTPVEPTRHLAIRLTASQYDRFVAYADKHRLTYHDALGKLLDTCGE